MEETKNVERQSDSQPNLPEARHAQRSYTQLRGRIANWLEGHQVSAQVREYLLLLPDLFALLIRLMRGPRVDKTVKVQLAIVGAYVISPIDLIPDFILPSGLIDDTVALAFILTRLVKIMGRTGEDILREHWEGRGDVLVRMRQISAGADRLLNDRVIGQLRKLFR